MTAVAAAPVPAVAVAAAAVSAAATAAAAAAAAKKNAGQHKYHASPKLLSQLQSMKKSPLSSQSSDADNDFSFKNIMGMMMMQQASDREERAAAREERHS